EYGQGKRKPGERGRGGQGLPAKNPGSLQGPDQGKWRSGQRARRTGKVRSDGSGGQTNCAICRGDREFGCSGSKREVGMGAGRYSIEASAGQGGGGGPGPGK